MRLKFPFSVRHIVFIAVRTRSTGSTSWSQQCTLKVTCPAPDGSVHIPFWFNLHKWKGRGAVYSCQCFLKPQFMYHFQCVVFRNMSLNKTEILPRFLWLLRPVIWYNQCVFLRCEICRESKIASSEKMRIGGTTEMAWMQICDPSDKEKGHYSIEISDGETTHTRTFDLSGQGNAEVKCLSVQSLIYNISYIIYNGFSYLFYLPLHLFHCL